MENQGNKLGGQALDEAILSVLAVLSAEDRKRFIAAGLELSSAQSQASAACPRPQAEKESA